MTTLCVEGKAEGVGREEDKEGKGMSKGKGTREGERRGARSKTGRGAAPPLATVAGVINKRETERERD